MSEPPPDNPYQAPLSDHFLDAVPEQTPAQLIDASLRFSGETDKADQLSVIKDLRIRRDYRSVPRILGTTSLFLTLAMVIVSPGDVSLIGWRLPLASLLLFVGIVGFRLSSRWFHLEILPNLQFAVGEISGVIDANTFEIRTSDYEFKCPVNRLVGCVASPDLLVLSFHRAYISWYVIPIEAFENPSEARRIGTLLSKAFPVENPGPETRLLDEPQSESLFRPVGDALRFSGTLHSEELRGSKFAKHSKQITRRHIFRRLLNLVPILLGIFVLYHRPGFRFSWEEFDLFPPIAGGAAIIGLIGFRVWRRRRARVGGKTPLWFSKGWIDEEAYVSNTFLGHSKVKWSFFSHAEVTDQLIILYPDQDLTVGIMISRSQFADDVGWEAATEHIETRFDRQSSLSESQE